jgi:hypothetical protein
MSTGDNDYQHREHHREHRREHRRADDHQSGAAPSAPGGDSVTGAVWS